MFTGAFRDQRLFLAMEIRGALLLGMSSEDWDTLDDAMAGKLVLTDVAFVSDKKKPPHDYEVVSWVTLISFLPISSFFFFFSSD